MTKVVKTELDDVFGTNMNILTQTEKKMVQKFWSISISKLGLKNQKNDNNSKNIKILKKSVRAKCLLNLFLHIIARFQTNRTVNVKLF